MINSLASTAFLRSPAMRKIINNPENFVDEMMDGIAAAYGDKVTFLNGDRRILISA